MQGNYLREGGINNEDIIQERCPFSFFMLLYYNIAFYTPFEDKLA